MKELREVIESAKFNLGLGNRELGQHLGFGRRYIDRVLREGVSSQKQIELIERINQLDNGVGFNEIDDSDKIKGLEHQVVMLQKDNDYFVKTNAELRKQIGSLESDAIGKDQDNSYRALALQIELGKANQKILDNEVEIEIKHAAWCRQLDVSKELKDQLKEKDEVINSQFLHVVSMQKKEENLSWLCLLLAVCWMATVVFYQAF